MNNIMLWGNKYYSAAKLRHIQPDIDEMINHGESVHVYQTCNCEAVLIAESAFSIFDSECLVCNNDERFIMVVCSCGEESAPKISGLSHRIQMSVLRRASTFSCSQIPRKTDKSVFFHGDTDGIEPNARKLTFLTLTKATDGSSSRTSERYHPMTTTPRYPALTVNDIDLINEPCIDMNPHSIHEHVRHVVLQAHEGRPAKSSKKK